MQTAAASPGDEVGVVCLDSFARASGDALHSNTGFGGEPAGLVQSAARTHPSVQPILICPGTLQVPLLQHIAVQNCFRECCSANFGLGSFGSSLDGGGAICGERCGSRSTLRGGQWRNA